MKNVWLLLVPAFLFFNCHKEEEPELESETQFAFSEPVQQEQEVLVTLVTRTECGACGEWGHPTFDAKVNNNANVNGLALHFRENDPMANEDATAWVDLVGWSATPSFGVGLTSQGPSESDWNNAVDNAQNEPLIAAIGIQGQGRHSEMEIDLSIQFYQDFASPMAIALYMVEDNFEAEQQDYSATPSTVQGYVHNQILRANVTNVWGNNLGNDFSNEEIITKTFTFNTDPVDRLENMKLVAVLFETDAQGNPVRVVNSKTAETKILSM